MYFPYLRGRQFELIALRELIEGKIIGNNILPIIEPIKLSSTLLTTLTSFTEEQRSIAVIHNPQVGSFSADIAELKNPITDKYLQLLKSKYIIKSHILNKDSDNELKGLLALKITKQELLIISNSRECLDKYTNNFSAEKPRYNLIPDESAFRRKVKDNKVIFNDKFQKLNRNCDYKGIDEVFSDDHLYYGDDGFIGFSDYSIVGSEYTEGGFAPYAVAIHIVYFDDEQILRIKHFVSESNEGIHDPAKKFYEALTKLAKWQEKKKLDTFGMNVFMEHYKNKTYPGLGTVKKLAIMHHIELLSKYLDQV